MTENTHDRGFHVGILLNRAAPSRLNAAPLQLFGYIEQPLRYIVELSVAARHEDGPVHAPLNMHIHWIGEHDSLVPDSSPSAGEANGGDTVTATTTHNSASYSSCPRLDILLVGLTCPQSLAFESPDSAQERTLSPPVSLDLIRSAHESGSTLIVVNHGIRQVAQADILDGRTAAAPETLLEGLRRDYPAVRWVARGWTRDSERDEDDHTVINGDGPRNLRGGIWTSGGLFEGAETMTGLVEEMNRMA